MDKSILDLATRSYSRLVQDLLVHLLNEGNKEVLKAHESALAMPMPGNLAQRLAALSTKLTPNLTTTTETHSTPATPTSVGERKKIVPERYGDYKDPLAAHSTSEEEDEDDKGERGDKDFDISSEKDDESDSENDPDDKSDFASLLDTDKRKISFEEDQSTDGARAAYGKLSMKEQEAFNQDFWNVQQLLALDLERVYTLDDLKDTTILGRGLRLLYLAKFGKKNINSRLSPHINYDKLPTHLSRAIEKKIDMEEHQTRECIALIAGRARL